MADETRPEEQAKAAQAPSDSGLSQLIQDMQDLVAANPIPPDDEVKTEEDESPVVRIANAILVTAIDNGASDCHIEPDRANVRVRLRVDGVVLQLMTIPKHVQRAISDRYKLMADIPADERDTPHQGFIPVRHGADNYNIRVSVVPSLYGEDFAFHLLRIGPFSTFDDLGIVLNMQKDLEQKAFFMRGLLLIAGPRGEGRTTTANVLLQRLNSVQRKICTYEDAPEIMSGGIIHTYRNKYGVKTKDWTPAEAVAALLRHNPDVLFLGDLDGSISAKAAVEAAQTGVLVVATITARDSVDALLRLAGWGIAPRDIANVVTGVVAQYLLPKICRDCRGEGCDACRKTGRKGRVGVFEVRGMGENERNMLAGKMSVGELRSLPPGKEAGQTGLREDARAKSEKGIISPEEVNRLSWMLPK